MRKYIIGFIVGAALTFSVQAGAASLLGSSVNAVIEVEVDGVNMGQAPVINGVSYLPVRKFGNEAGYKVNFGEGKATLTSENSEIAVPKTEASNEPALNNQQYTDQEISDKIVELEGRIKATQLLAEGFMKAERTDEEATTVINFYRGLQKELEEWKQLKAQQ